jgi:hypothetical protein
MELLDRNWKASLLAERVVKGNSQFAAAREWFTHPILICRNPTPLLPAASGRFPRIPLERRQIRLIPEPHEQQMAFL